MRRLLFFTLSLILFSSCKDSSSLEDKYENKLADKINSFVTSNKLTKNEAKLLYSYINSIEKDSTFKMLNGKKFKDILVFAKSKFENENRIIDSINLAIQNTKIEKKSTIVCSGPIPNGYVITDYHTCSSCPQDVGQTNNCITISLPSDNMTICSSSPVPNGYVVVDYSTCGTCPRQIGETNNCKTIRLLSDNMTICSSSPVPNGYVVVDYSTCGTCPRQIGETNNCKTIRLPSDNMSICSSSPVPNGYVVIDYSTCGTCPRQIGETNNCKTIKKLQ